MTLLTVPCQVWLAQARLPENCKKTLRELPIVPGHLFGPNVSEVLQKRMKLSEATRQLTQVLRAPPFRMPLAPAHPRYLESVLSSTTLPTKSDGSSCACPV